MSQWQEGLVQRPLRLQLGRRVCAASTHCRALCGAEHSSRHLLLSCCRSLSAQLEAERAARTVDASQHESAIAQLQQQMAGMQGARLSAVGRGALPWSSALWLHIRGQRWQQAVIQQCCTCNGIQPAHGSQSPCTTDL